MSIPFAGAMGAEFSAQFTWTADDTILYALAVGATVDAELDSLYEARGPVVLPTFAVLLGQSFLDELMATVDAHWRSALHAEQELRIHRPLPPAGDAWTVARVAEVWDKGRAALIVIESESTDGDGPLASHRAVFFMPDDGGFGGERGPSSARDDPVDEGVAVAQATAPEQAALYRLTWDRNPLHIDPDVARANGFEKPILNGMCAFGFLGRHAARLLANGDVRRMRTLRARFVEPVFPGDELETTATSSGALTMRADGRVALTGAASFG